MLSLITACLEAGDIGPIHQFPVELMEDNDKKRVGWITTYYAKHKKLPSLARFVSEFSTFVPSYPAEDQPLEDVLEQEIEERRRQVATARLNDILYDLEAEEAKLPVSKIQELATLLASTSTGVERYSAFDRSHYFRDEERLYFGFPILDHLTGGISRGDMDVIAGRLGTGKTTVALWIAHNWLEQGKRIMLVSCEMAVTDVFARLDAMMGRFNPLLLRGEAPSGDLKAKVSVISHRASKMKGELIIPKQRLITPMAIKGMAQHLAVDAVVVDGMYLLRPDHHVQAKWERVSEVSNALKQAALDLNVPFLCVTQQKRGETDDPSAEDIGYSDSIAQDADRVYFVVPEKAEKTRVEMRMIKNRYGSVGSALLLIDFDTMTVRDTTEVI